MPTKLSSKRYDVIVVGGGPAGGQCVRQLSKKGFKTLLVERFESFQKNNYSSAGTILEFVDEFKIPPSVIGSYWNKLTVVSSSGTPYQWNSEKPMGIVMDFGRLKGFLAGEAVRDGADVLMNHQFKSFEKRGDSVFASLENTLTKETSVFEARLLVDATGRDRSVMRGAGAVSNDYVEGVGIEYLIEVPPSCHRPDELIFFLGNRWAPRGYSWIFPMENNRLKIGMGQVSLPSTPSGLSLRHYVDLVINDYLRLPFYKTIDIHGGRIVYSRGQKDRYFADGVLAVGDCVSAINMLGGEGIRHGMKSADMAVESVEQFLRTGVPDFRTYEKLMKAYFGTRWKRSVRIAKIFYVNLKDSQVDWVLQRAARKSMHDIVGVLFHYRFHRVVRTLLRSFFARLFGSAPLKPASQPQA